ncbi:threonine/homoserine/homoserine lactone efflux protein [Natronoflexus pectinivorans]|uniref:Threonine/homoserine/homoserine lactone efflux protein n=2 Tax=Natronoflexus pectinivorans TaxID=682526 RepID=A0A4R2GG56_9BACT|nr:threonine/homoserine/homoserine lactone efflux protein [Natronoflexus pectinivorans]
MNPVIDGIIVGFSASVPLGPIGVLCIQRTLQRGRLSGFVSGLGAAVSDTIYAIIAGFSLSFIVAFIEEHVIWMQLIGATVLIILGVHIFRSNPAVQLRRQRRRKSSYLHDFLSTMLLTISNPLALFLFLAFFAGLRVVDPAMGLAGQLTLVGGVLIGASSWWLLLTTIVGFFQAAVNLRRLFWINKIAGATIIVLVIIALMVWFIRSMV